MEKKNQILVWICEVLRVHFPFISHQKSEAIPKDFYSGRENCIGNDPIIKAFIWKVGSKGSPSEFG